MSDKITQRPLDKEPPALRSKRRATYHRWERRMHCVLWGLAAACLALDALLWWQLLRGLP